MDAGSKEKVDRQIAAHEAAHADDVARYRAMSVAERVRLLEAACRAAAIQMRDRAAAGLPPVQPVPWPQSTWDFLKFHAERVRNGRPFERWPPEDSQSS
jgi:hypothetical protein